MSIVYRVSTREAASFTEALGPPKILGPHRFDTLDLLVPKDEDYQTLVRTLEDLMALYHEERRTYDHFSLFLQYHWIDFGKELNGRLSSSEWIALCDKANIPLAKPLLLSHYKDFCEDRGVEEEGLFLTETAELVAEVREAAVEVVEGHDDPLTKLWKQIMDSDPIPPLKYENNQTDLELEVNEHEESISAIALLSFLRSQQREFTTALEDVHRLVGVLNSQKSLEEDNNSDDDDDNRIFGSERLRKSRFLAFLLSDANDIVDPQTAMVGACDMQQPLTNYWINTSHDTYLSKLPNTFRFKDMDFEGHTTVDAQAYANALYRGVRCLELDVYDGLFDGPIVSRHKPTSPSDNQSIAFSRVLKSIRSFMRKNPSAYPIILCIENHCSVANQGLMAKSLKEIFEPEGMLYKPSQDILANETKPLPSPHTLRGKILVKSKRPKVLKTGATVLNDDFDDDFILSEQPGVEHVGVADWDDDEEDESVLGAVMRFDPAGPIRSSDPNAPRKSPRLLLETARQEALEAKEEAARALAKENELKNEAASAKALAQSMIEASGLTAAEVETRAAEENEIANGKEVGDRNSVIRSPKAVPRDDLGHSLDEGLEVQDFFGNAVDGARSGHSEADAHAIAAANLAAQALERLSDAEHALMEAESSLEESYLCERQKAEEAMKAANDVRVNREHAEIARRRVETVKGLLRNSKSSASSAETVVVTAMTEAKISEQRASETEARASRALAMAEKERIRADAETRKEEILEQETANLHDLSLSLTKDSNSMRQKMEKTASILEKLNEQIKLIERSSQFQRELKEYNRARDGDYLNETPRHGGNFLAKHNAKVQERDACMDLMKEVKLAHQSVEVRRKRVQAAFEEKAHLWKMQADVASQARKQADRSSQHAEELAENAEEEREAASLRHIAREKAQNSVAKSDDYQTSIQAQLIEASRASEEAASLALESRILADKLAREAEFAKDHSEKIKHVANMQKSKDEAQIAYEAALENKHEAESKAAAAKRLLDTSSEVFTNAKRDAASEINNAIAKRERERDAVQAFRKAQLAKSLHESSSLQLKMTQEAAAEKASAAIRAQEYKFKMDRLSPISLDLSLLTCLHSTKFKSWVTSLTLPNSYMHSLCDARVSQMLKNDEEGSERQNFTEFTKNHFIRTFPSWRLIKNNKRVNYNPVVAHGLGCQLVSMNYHSSDEHLLLNEGRFRANGSCGYVLKPQELAFGVEKSEKWKFTILCGTCLPKGEKAMGRKSLAQGTMQYISPFVRVSLYQGTDQDASKAVVHRTITAKQNGLNPVWSHGSNECEVHVTRPSVAMIMFTVWDDATSDFIAGSAIPVSCIRAGYRSIALFDSLHSRSGPYAFTSLFVKAQKSF